MSEIFANRAEALRARRQSDAEARAKRIDDEVEAFIADHEKDLVDGAEVLAKPLTADAADWIAAFERGGFHIREFGPAERRKDRRGGAALIQVSLDPIDLDADRIAAIEAGQASADARRR